MRHFIDRFSRLQGRMVTGISQEALSLLMFHDYPGNIWELENVIEHALVLCPDGEIGVQCLPENLQSESLNIPEAGMEAILQNTEAQVIQDALKRNQWNRLAAAKDLSIHKSTLFRKIKKLNIKMPKADGRTRIPAS